MNVLIVHTRVIPQPPVRTQKAAIHVLATVATQAMGRHAMVLYIALGCCSVCNKINSCDVYFLLCLLGHSPSCQCM